MVVLSVEDWLYALGKKDGMENLQLRTGPYLGDCKKSGLSAILVRSGDGTSMETGRTGPFEPGRSVVIRYLKGEMLRRSGSEERKAGQLVCVDGYPLWLGENLPTEA